MLPTSAVWACLLPQPCLLTCPQRPTHCPACPAQPCILHSLWPTSTTFTCLMHYLCLSCAPPLPILHTTFTCLAHWPISCHPSCTTSVHPPSVFTPPLAPALPSTACCTAPISHSLGLPALSPNSPTGRACLTQYYPSDLVWPISCGLNSLPSPSSSTPWPCPSRAALAQYHRVHLTQPQLAHPQS